MSPDAQAILTHLQAVADLRQRQALDPALAEHVRAVKLYQHQRFERSYDDLLRDRDFAPAAHYFMTDLYGPGDFSLRDTQFGRIVPKLDRLFSGAVVHTVLDVAELHALSEALDTEMGQALADLEPGRPIDAQRYARAWCQVGRPALRERQIMLMLQVGRALVSFTRKPLLRRSLHLMRVPARLAGLHALHGFLERGFDTFADLRDPNTFLETIARRERELAASLFGSGP